MVPRLRARLYDILEKHDSDSPWSPMVDAFLVALILVNVTAVILESVKSLHDVYQDYFFAFEAFSVAIFTAEYVIRVWIVPEDPHETPFGPYMSRIRYMTSPMAIIDLLAILPFYLLFFFTLDLRFLRVFRLLRLLKLTRYSPALATVAKVLAAQRRSLMAALMIMMTLLVFGGSVAYLLEHKAQPDAFGSIPDAIWWAMATLTTVGFGDVTPVTPAGKVFGGLLMICGVGMYALPAGILATGFAQEFRKHDFRVTWSMVARVPIFAGVDAGVIAEIVDRLIPLVVPARHVIVRRGEVSDAMYFIANGDVEVDLIHSPPRHLSDGDFFGEIGVLMDRKRTATVTAINETRLMVLEAADLKGLVDEHPVLEHNLSKVLNERLHELEEIGQIHT
jgi:voltage-gated potassium channel